MKKKRQIKRHQKVKRKPFGVKHTEHSNIRLEARALITPGALRRKIRAQDFIGLPKQTNNKRCAVVPDADGKPLVVVWMKTTLQIVTVMPLAMYLERHEIPATSRAQIEEKHGLIL